MKKLLLLLSIACCLQVSAQTPKKKVTEPKVDSMSATMKPVTTPAGEPLLDTGSGYQKWEEHKSDSSNFRPMKYNKGSGK